MFSLQFDPKDISLLAARYWTSLSDKEVKLEKELEEGIGPRVRERGHFTKSEFLKLCRWKSPRTQSRCAKNPAEDVEEVTRVALSSKCERVRIGMPTLLYGVARPTASVILHFGSTEPYPILDFRALESLGYKPRPPGDFEFWWAYTAYCRGLARRHEVSMRCLDRALWQFSKQLLANRLSSYAIKRRSA